MHLELKALFFKKLRSVIAVGLLPLFLLFNSASFAQNNKLSFDKLTVESGLSQSSVFSITQDSMGFMWFGTKDGLNRYDSQQFEVFRHHDGDSTSLSSSQNINALLTDTRGNLWIGTQDGLNRYQPETNSFIHYLNEPKNLKSLSNNTIRCLYEDHQGNIWVGTENGLNKLLKDGNFERFFCNQSPGAGLVHSTVKTIFQDNRNTLWVGTQNGLVNVIWRNQTPKFITYFHDANNPRSIASNDISTITEDLNHNIWIGHHFAGLDFFDRANNSFNHVNGTKGDNQITSKIIRKILLDKDGLLWIATLNGISIYDPVNHRFSNHIHDPEDPNSLNQNSIYELYQDAVGSVWLGTYYGGVNVYHPNAIPFKVYKHYSYKNSLSSNIISSIVEDKKQNLWIGTEAEGLNYLNRKTGVFTSFKSSTAQNSLSSNLIKSIGIDQNQNLWIAAYEGGLDFYNTQTQRFKNYKLDPTSSLSANRVTYLNIDHQNRLWVGTKGKGLFLYSPKTDDFQSLIRKNSAYYFYPKNINYLFEDEQRTLWVATDVGVFFMPIGADNFKKFTSTNSNFFININCITQSDDGKLWFGSYNEGIVSLNPKNKSFQFYTVNEGLPSNNIAGILEDDDQHIWVSTDQGLARLNKNGFNVYNRNDGLPGNVFNYHSYLKDDAGELYFGGYNGLVSFHPNDIISNPTAPKIVFTHLRVFNKEVTINDNTHILKKALNSSDKLVFNYQQNIFSIDFAALNFVKSKKNKYAYKLDGFEKEWNYVSNPTATFTNLPDGTYTLLVKATNNDGVWNPQVKGLKIVILPPYWKTWWAYLIYAIILGAVLYLILRFLFIRALLKHEHDAHQMKLEFFTNVSHEIRTPLTLILGPLEKLIQDTQQNFTLNKQLHIVNKNAKRLMRLVNELLDFRKIESGKMKLNIVDDNIISFVKEIFLSFQHVALQKGIQYQFKAQDDFIEAFFDKDQLEKVIFNLLSNAIKFTAEKEGKISLEISQSQDYIFIKVKDNGEGIPKENRNRLFTDFYQVTNQKKRNTGTGIGLALSKSIARIHHGDLTLEDDEQRTVFCLSLRKGKFHFRSDEISNSMNVDDHDLYELQSEVDALIYDDEVKKKNSISAIQPLLLIVEDNAEVKNFLTKSLDKKFQILTANNGLEALPLAFEKLPDVIISDVMMPEMDGYELCNKVKSDERTRHIPVILLTARSGELHEIEGLKTGADIYLTKPFSTQKLNLVIENLIALHEHMRNKFSQQFIAQPSEVEIESTDEEFLNKVLKLLEENISNSEFNVNQFAADIGMSTPVFYKKIKALTGLTVNNFVKSIRLKRAVQLLSQEAGNISEVAYMVGFNDAKYFSKEFRKQFGKSPSSFIDLKKSS